MRKNLLTQILLSFLALALLASASPAQSTESTKGTQPAATPKTTKTKISAKKAALVDINSASKEELDLFVLGFRNNFLGEKLPLAAIRTPINDLLCQRVADPR